MVVMSGLKAPKAARRGRPRIADRARLLDAAERAIRRAGPTVSLERIASEAGVTKPVVFAHVGDRRALVHALGERLLGHIEASIQTALAGGSEGRAALERVIAAYFAAVQAHRHLYAFVNGGGASDKSLASTLAFAQRAAAPLIAGISDARARSGRDTSRGRALGLRDHRHAEHGGALVARGAEAASSTPPRLAAQLTELLWSGLAPPPGS